MKKKFSDMSIFFYHNHFSKMNWDEINSTTNQKIDEIERLFIECIRTLNLN